jgi:hypothetical protein
LRICVCYLDCHEAGLCCCYLVIHIENLLRPFGLFYFHLWPIYWLSLLLRPQAGWLCQETDEKKASTWWNENGREKPT